MFCQAGGHDSVEDIDGITTWGKNQIDLREYKQEFWPSPSQEFYQHPSAATYRVVKDTGVPNEVGAKVLIHRALDIQRWRTSAQGHSDDSIVMNGIQFGFSLQYSGPTLNEVQEEAHASGRNYPDQVTKYLETEIREGAIIGPFMSPPFVPWCRTSPIMSRPKGEGNKRRIIVDLSYPPDSNVNQGVTKNNYYGTYISHRLPRIDDVVDKIVEKGFNVALATVDIRRAYRNFPGCPLDYPLNVVKYQSKYYLDPQCPLAQGQVVVICKRLQSLSVGLLQQWG